MTLVGVVKVIEVCVYIRAEGGASAQSENDGVYIRKSSDGSRSCGRCVGNK